jgi:hypothetical protein
MRKPLPESATKVIRIAIRDFVLRVLFCLSLLAFGFWLPEEYLLSKYGIFVQLGVGALAGSAFFFAKLAAFVYGAVAILTLFSTLVALSSQLEKTPDGQPEP